MSAKGAFRVTGIGRVVVILGAIAVSCVGSRVYGQHGFPPNGAWVYGTKPYLATAHAHVGATVHYAGHHHRWHHFHHRPIHHHHAHWIGFSFSYPNICMTPYPIGWGYTYYRVRYYPVHYYYYYQTPFWFWISSNTAGAPGLPVAAKQGGATVQVNFQQRLARGDVAGQPGPDLRAVLQAHRGVQQLAAAEQQSQPDGVKLVQHPVAIEPKKTEFAILTVGNGTDELELNGSRGGADDEPDRLAIPASSAEEIPITGAETIPPVLLDAADQIFDAGGYREAAKAYAELTYRYGNSPRLMLRRFAAQVASRDYEMAEATSELASALGMSLIDVAEKDTEFVDLVSAVPDRSGLTEEFARRGLARMDDPLTLKALAVWLYLGGDRSRSQLFLQRAEQLER